MIKCSQFAMIFRYGSGVQLKNDAETWKYKDRLGLETLLVYTVNDEYWF